MSATHPYPERLIERDADGKITWPPDMATMGLFPYQMDAFGWLLSHPKSILADEMGLGKTVVVGRLLHYITFGGSSLTPFTPKLILGPAILGYNWQDELRDKFGLHLDVATGNGKEDLRLLSESSLVYTNPEKLNVARYNDVLQRRRWGTLIVDESHKIRGHKAKRSKELVRLAGEIGRVHFLTGTPFPQGSPADVFVPIACFDGDVRRAGFWKYVGDWCATGVGGGEQGTWREIGPAKQPHAFGGWMTKWMLRRTRKEVGSQLPPLLRTTMRHSLSPRQRTLYRSMAKGLSFVTKAGVVVEAQNSAVQWQALRMVCLSPRLFDGSEEVGARIETIGEIIEQAHAAGRKVVVFTWHREMARLLATLIGEAYPAARIGGSIPIIAGGVPRDVSNNYIRRFGEQDGFAVMVGTIAAMGTGLNLQAASIAIFAELSYVPDDNDQALARLHREGQENPVNAYFPVARGTIEEYIREQVLIKKQNVTKLLDAHRMVQEIKRLDGV